ncbi:MAG: glycosyltransferase family 2 protein [Bacteroidales bacterium]|nr:glycosyltransferase family 2 protein [Bacteroidales bacterium]MBN2818360.1 glycosyltransferase family 2 protein [Bacteroidales bacterium]
MQYLAYIAMAFAAFQFVNVCLNVLFRQRIKHTGLTAGKLISVLIPARNEEDNIGMLLDDLRQMTRIDLEIIVYDDQSTDNTLNFVKKHSDLDNRIKLLQSKTLPDGWLGKNHACYQLAQQAKGSHLLFLDADVRIHGEIIEHAVSYLEKHKLGLLSVFPTQIQKTLGEKLTVPIMNYILLTLLPLVFVRVSPFSSHSAANGQFMLFNGRHYKSYQPHKIFKTSPVEDIAIARYYKEQKIKTACISGEERIKCRMYKNYQEALKGFSKNIFMFFGDNRILAFFFWLFASLGFIPILVSYPNLLWIYFLPIVIIQILYSFISRQPILLSILLFPAQLLFMLLVMIKSIKNHANKEYSWKGRNIYS